MTQGEQPPQPRIIAVVNQKGGVAKTTTTHHLGAGFAALGYRVLLVDLDPQASLTYCVGADPEEISEGSFEALTGTAKIPDVIWETGDHDYVTGTLHLVPATDELIGAELALSKLSESHTALSRALKGVLEHYDLVFVDCSPTLGQLTLNALTAAHNVVIPMSCDMLSHRGTGQLLDTIADVQRLINPGLAAPVLLPTMYDARLSHARAVVADLPERYGLTVLDPIPRSVRFAETPALGLSVYHTAKSSRGAKAYQKAVADLATAWNYADHDTTDQH